MKTTLRIVSFLSCVAAICLFAGCQTYPMGLSKEKWDALPAEKQVEYRNQQNQIDAERRAKAEAMRQEREQRLRQEEAQKEQQVASAYANAQFGDIIVVSFERGAFAFGGLGKTGHFQKYDPFTLELVKGQQKTVMVYNAERRGAFAPVTFLFANDGVLHINQVHNTDYGNAKHPQFPNNGWAGGRTYGPLALMFQESPMNNGQLTANVFMRVQYKAL